MPAGTGTNAQPAQLVRLAAFTDDPSGGNPAGVWIGDTLPSDATMLRIAADVGYSETAFLAPVEAGTWTTRYFSPVAEVSFCGHATIAAAVALCLSHGPGLLLLQTKAGDVRVDVHQGPAGHPEATLTSVATSQRDCPPELLSAALGALGWSHDDLDRGLSPALSYAGAWHLILAIAERRTLAAMSYDFESLRETMEAHDLTTAQIIWREDPFTFHSRNPFPVGGIVEDPATGAAAAAFGGYLRRGQLIEPPADIVIHQGHDMGRPSRIDVTIPPSGGVRVTGTAVAIPS